MQTFTKKTRNKQKSTNMSCKITINNKNITVYMETNKKQYTGK